MENQKIKVLTQTALFFSLCSTLVLLQIPVYGFLNLDFSLVALILSIRFVGYRNATLISLVYPWFAMLSYLPADFVGALILMTLALVVILFDFVFNKTLKTKNYFNLFMITLCSTLTISLLNVFFFTPLYFDFNYRLIFETFWYYFGMYLGFNSIKIFLNYLIEFILYKQIYKEVSNEN